MAGLSQLQLLIVRPAMILTLDLDRAVLTTQGKTVQVQTLLAKGNGHKLATQGLDHELAF